MAALLAGGLLATARGVASAADPTAVEQVPIVPVGTACPGGTLVFVNSGTGGGPEAVIALIPAVQSGGVSTGCPSATDVLATPGASTDGGAVALPLSADDCAAGTALFDTEIPLIGGTPPSTSVGGSLALSGGSVTLSGGTLTVGGSLSSSGGSLSLSGGSLSLSGGTLSLPDGSLPLTGGSLNLSGGNSDTRRLCVVLRGLSDAVRRLSVPCRRVSFLQLGRSARHRGEW